MDREAIEQIKPTRDPRMIFVDTRDADITLLNRALGMLSRRGEKCSLVTVGPVEGLETELPRCTVSERDEPAQMLALHQAAIAVSARPGASADHHAVRALTLGCWPIFPDTGVYPEMLPHSMHELCLYDCATADRLATQIQNAWWIERPREFLTELPGLLAPFDPLKACHAIDERLDNLC